MSTKAFRAAHVLRAASFELDLHLLQTAYGLVRSITGAGRPEGEPRQQARVYER